MKRKTEKNILIIMVEILTMLFLSACGREGTVTLSNEQSFSLDGISDLTISYDDENICFFMSENENLIIREYMSEDKKAYHAKIRRKKDSIQISEGGKPIFKSGFIRYVEVYLPASYSSNIKVTATDGEIDMSEIELDMDSVRVDCTSGTFRLNKAVAEEIYFSSTSGELELGEVIGNQIRIETTQGNVTCENIKGNVTYTSTSGNAQFLSASGSGVYKANNSGSLSVIYDEVTGDLSFFNKNDDIVLQLPQGLSFQFEAIIKNGKIDTDFQGDISVNGDSASGIIGANPTVTIKAETRNGNIEVSQ